MDLLDRDPPRNDTYLQITTDGVGPINAETPATETAIGNLMSGYTTGTVLTGLETETTSAIVLFKSGSGGQIQVLNIIGNPQGKIREIQGVSHHVMGPGGETPGMTLNHTSADIASCRTGTALWLGMVVCKSSKADNVRLLFSLKDDTATGGKLPPRAELDRGELQRIIWTPTS